MASEEDEAKPEEVTAFLVAAYEAINEEGRRLRVEGLARLNFFLTLTAALFTGVVYLYQAESQTESPDFIFVQIVALGASLFLILIGWYTFLYTIQRDIYADFNIRATGRISRYFSDLHPGVRPHLLWQDHDEPTIYVTHNHSAIRRILEVVLSFLVALVIGLTTNLVFHSPVSASTTAVLGLLITWRFVHWYSARKYRLAFDKARTSIRFPKPQR